MIPRAESTALLAAVILVGCAEVAPECNVGADCASGACSAAGECVEPMMLPGTDAGASTDAATADDAGTVVGTDASGPACADGDFTRIDREEVPLEPGLSAPFLVASNVSFDSAGALLADGTRAWDFTPSLPGDAAEEVSLDGLAGSWFAPLFPGATYASVMPGMPDLLGVYETTADALLLRGIVSSQPGLLRTELIYDPPVVLLSFPLVPGATWATTASVTGYAGGTPSVYTETYQGEVDAVGLVSTPFADFQVQRVSLDLTRVVGAVPSTRKSFLYVAECFGVVATVASQWNALFDEITFASEVRRLGP